MITKLLTLLIGVVLGFGGVQMLQGQPLLGAAPVCTVSQGCTGKGTLAAGKYLTGNGTGAVTLSTCVDITGSAYL